MTKYTVEDLDPRNWENQIEKDIIEDADKAHDSIAAQWTSPLKGLFGGELNEGGNPIINHINHTNTYFDNYWKEKMRQQRNHKK